MAVVDARTWIEHLSVQDCWELLAATPVGRIAVLIDGEPVIFPVNFVVDERMIIFRTDPGNKLHSIAKRPAVCFEIDDIDVASKTGWSVVVKGRAGEITSSEEAHKAGELPLDLWTIGAKAHWIRIVPLQVTGRRVHAVLPRR